MTLADLKTRLIQRLDDHAGAGFYSETDLTNALNWAQRLFVLLSLCLEKQTAFVPTGQFSHLRSQIPDWFLPLELRYSNTVRYVAGVASYGYLASPMVNSRIRPATLQQLNARHARWIGRAIYPGRYALLGGDFLALDSAPPLPLPELIVRYVYSPPLLAADADQPQIPATDQPSLAEGAIALLRLREGGQELQKAAQGPLQSFLHTARSRASQMRAKNRAQQYDSVPAELTLADMSRTPQAK